MKIKFITLIFCFLLGSCSTTTSTKNALSTIRQDLKSEHAINNGDIVALFDLQKLSKDDKLYSPYYGKIINSSILAKKFVSDFEGSLRIRSNLHETAFYKMARLSNLVNELNKKYKILDGYHTGQIKKLNGFFAKNKTYTNKPVDFVAELSKLQDTVKNIPLLVPLYRPQLTSKFGKRQHYYTKKIRMHHGVDLVGKLNCEIYASADGIIEQISTIRGYGNMIVINHKNGLKTRYAHLSKFRIKQGEKVRQGQLIGIQGKTGTANGHHLHYEILHNNKPIDPLLFMEQSL